MRKEDLWIKAMEWGARMGCHQRADRSFYINGFQFPLCARCTGIIFTAIIGYVIYFINRTRLVYGIILCIPMIVDGGIQYIGIKESTNLRRFLTGMLGGIGLVVVRLNIYVQFIKLIKFLFGIGVEI